MCKNSNLNTATLPTFSSVKMTAPLYRKKLALKIKETLENEPITDEDFNYLTLFLENSSKNYSLL